MGLTERLAAWAACRPHVFLVPVPGATSVRLALEATCAEIDAVSASNAADADIVAVAGAPGPELSAAIDLVWSQVPGPRSRVEVHEPTLAGESVRRAVDELSAPAQRVEALGRRDEWVPGDAEDMPGGLMMADTGPDRDGLTLDVLHVPLGPVLTDWPAGLVIDTVLQGDVIQEARARVLPAAGVTGSFWNGADGRRRAAGHLDSLARLLAVAGWEAGAHRSRLLRDELLGSGSTEQVRSDFAALRRRIERSRLLRWATDGLGVIDGSDATARCLRRLDETARLLAGAQPAGEPVAPLSVTAGLLAGLDLAAARLVVASVDPDTDELAAVREKGVR